MHVREKVYRAKGRALLEVAGYAVRARSFSCRVQWQELDYLLLNCSRQGVLFGDIMMTEENSVEMGQSDVGLNSLGCRQAFCLWLLKACLCVCISEHICDVLLVKYCM